MRRVEGGEIEKRRECTSQNKMWKCRFCDPQDDEHHRQTNNNNNNIDRVYVGEREWIESKKQRGSSVKTCVKISFISSNTSRSSATRQYFSWNPWLFTPVTLNSLQCRLALTINLHVVLLSIIRQYLVKKANKINNTQSTPIIKTQILYQSAEEIVWHRLRRPTRHFRHDQSIESEEKHFKKQRDSIDRLWCRNWVQLTLIERF